jgi:VanZ family protein
LSSQGVIASVSIDLSRVTNVLRAWGPAAAWAAVLFLSSAQSDIAATGWLSRVPDEALHVVAYAVLGATLAHARFWGGTAVPHIAMIALGALFGVSDEFHQSFVPGRVPAVGDWLADVVGLTAGYTMAWLTGSKLLRPDGVNFNDSAT